jgi:hypothetical protein
MILIIYSNERYDKIKILKSISDADGVIESLDQLEQIPIASLSLVIVTHKTDLRHRIPYTEGRQVR